MFLVTRCYLQPNVSTEASRVVLSHAIARVTSSLLCQPLFSVYAVQRVYVDILTWFLDDAEHVLSKQENVNV